MLEPVIFTFDDSRAIVDILHIQSPQPTPPRDLFEDTDESHFHTDQHQLKTPASSSSPQPTNTVTMSLLETELENASSKSVTSPGNTILDADGMDLVYPELEQVELTPPTFSVQNHQLFEDIMATSPLPCNCIGLEHCGVSLDPMAQFLGLEIPSIVASTSQETANIIARWTERHSSCPSSERALTEQQFKYLSQWIIEILGRGDSNNIQLCVAVLKHLSS
jgi:hypothetical protein